MGLVHWFCNLSPIVTVCMQAQTHGSSQQAESASWVITSVSMADGACAFVLQLKPHCHCMHASTNQWQLTASRECLLGNYTHLYGRWGLSIGFKIRCWGTCSIPTYSLCLLTDQSRSVSKVFDTASQLSMSKTVGTKL